MTPHGLPLPLRLAIRLLPADVRLDVAAELMDRFERLRDERGARAARRWAWRQPAVAVIARWRWGRPNVEQPDGSGAMWTGLRDDLNLAIRGGRRRPALTTAIVATVAISAGAVGATTSVIDAVLLRPLPYPDAGRLVWVNSYERSEGGTRPASPFVGMANPHDVTDWQARSRTFVAMTAIEGFDGTIEARGEPVRVEVGKVQATTGRVLGISAAHGRLFVDDDYAAGMRVMVLTDPIWRRLFSADAGIVGRTVPLSGVPFTVVGILPPMPVPFPDDTVDVWLPLSPPSPASDPRQRGGVWQGVLGRIAPDTTLAVAQADMDRVTAELAAEFPQTNARRGVVLVPYRDGLVGSTRTVLWLLSAAILVVLAIACANVGHLLLLSVHARRREFALRAALGARTARLARLVLVESAVLAATGGLAGLVLLPWFLNGFLAAYPDALPSVGDIVVSPRALAATGASAFAAFVALAVPTLLSARAGDLARRMRATDRGSDSRGERHMRGALVVAQVALSTALLIGGGLLLRTFLDVRGTPLGFAPEGLLTFNVALPDTRYASRAAEVAFHRDLSARIDAIPGVVSSGSSSLLPLSAGDFIDGFARIGEADEFPNMPTARLQNVTPGYLEALGLPIVRGRTVQPADAVGSAPVVVVNESLERQYFPDGAVGRRIRFRGAVREIVGVVGDKRHRSLREAPRADLYVPKAQADWPRWFAWVVVRHSGSLDSLVPAIRAAVRDVDSGVAIDAAGLMTDRVRQTLAPDRFRAVLVGALAVVAVGLAMIGLYGLVAHAVAREARDTAIRMALGAHASRAATRVLVRVLTLATTGVLVGLGGAWFARELVATFMTGVGPGDPWTLSAVVGALLSLSVMAAAGPALRASRIDPATVLRGD